MAWFWLAIISAALYGVCYASMEHLLKFYSTGTIFAASYISGVIIWVGYMLATRSSGKLVELVSGEHKYYMLAYVVAVIVANFLMYQATAMKGATMPAMVEITYPLFTALAVFLMFGGIQLSVGMLAGGALIMAGVGCIYMWS